MVGEEKYKSTTVEKPKKMVETIFAGAKESFAAAKEKLKDNESLKKFNNVATDWKKDVSDSINLKRELKKENIERKDQGSLYGKKTKEILTVEDDIKKADSDFKTEQKQILANRTMMEAYMKANPDDEDIKKVFNQEKAEQDEDLKNAETLKKEKEKILGQQKDDLALERKGYEDEVKEIEKKMAERIDNKIKVVRERHDFDNKVKDSKQFGEDIKNFQSSIQESEAKLKKYKGMITGMNLKEGGKARLDLEESSRVLEAKIADTKKQLMEAKEKKDKLDLQIGKINKKTAKWENLKGKYGLKKPEETAQENANVGAGGGSVEFRGGGGGVSPENLEEIDYTTGIEKDKEKNKPEKKVEESKEKTVQEEQAEEESKKKENLSDIQEKIRLLSGIELISINSEKQGEMVPFGLDQADRYLKQFLKINNERNPVIENAINTIKFQGEADDMSVLRTVAGQVRAQRKMLEESLKTNN